MGQEQTATMQSITLSALRASRNPQMPGFGIDGLTHVGSIDTVRTNTGQNAVVWRFVGGGEDREVWVGESAMVGRKRAVLDALTSTDTRRRIERMEAKQREQIRAAWEAIEREERGESILDCDCCIEPDNDCRFAESVAVLG